MAIAESSANRESVCGRVPELTKSAPYGTNPAERFEDLNISKALLRGLHNEMNFDRPRKLQAEALPLILGSSDDLLVWADEGFGKRTCLVLGMLGRIDPTLEKPQALCLCSTLERALEIHAILVKMAKYSGITSVCAEPQKVTHADCLKSAVGKPTGPLIADQVVIGTFDTITSLIRLHRTLMLENLNVFVLDEADHMFTVRGFEDSFFILRQEVLNATKNRTQVLLFSESVKAGVVHFATEFMPMSNKIIYTLDDPTLFLTMKQYRVGCRDYMEKLMVLTDGIYSMIDKFGRSIIFAGSRHVVLDVQRMLKDDGHDSIAIVAGQTSVNLDDFNSGKTRILITNEMFVEEIDTCQVSLVVNFDPPLYPEIYLRRIGRTWRYGHKGAAFNFVLPTDPPLIDNIQRFYELDMPLVPGNDYGEFERIINETEFCLGDYRLD